MKTPFKVLLLATIISILAVTGFEIVDYYYGPLGLFYTGSAVLLLLGLWLAVTQIREVTKTIKEREGRWKH